MAMINIKSNLRSFLEDEEVQYLINNEIIDTLLYKAHNELLYAKDMSKLHELLLNLNEKVRKEILESHFPYYTAFNILKIMLSPKGNHIEVNIGDGYAQLNLSGVDKDKNLHNLSIVFYPKSKSWYLKDIKDGYSISSQGKGWDKLLYHLEDENSGFYDMVETKKLHMLDYLVD